MEDAAIRFDVIGLFPEIVDSCCRYGVVGRALQRGTVAVVTHQLRDYTGGSHHPIDDDPYGASSGDADGYAEALERIELHVTLRNGGTLAAQDPFPLMPGGPLAKSLEIRRS